MRCSCFGGPRVDSKNGTAAGTLHGIDGDLLQDINHLSYKELRSATDNFHTSNKIGQGGFGTVYKGTLKSGTQVAVKPLSAQSNQGSRSTDIKLDWGRRSAICLGIARGLDFLHKEVVPHIVHRDIKASNILLDKDFNPKIGDFGLAKLFPDNITHISTRIAGTTGYLAPEYALGGQLTMKADVYSFGVLILEIVSGRSSAKPSWGGTQKLLLEWAWQLHEEGKHLELVDPEMGEFPEEEVIRYIKVAFFCTQSAANRRPIMTQVVDMLSRQIQLNDKELTAPGFFQDSDSPSGGPSSTKGSYADSTRYQMSSVPVRITEVTPR
ncbi:cold-responsive protein kinase 1-like isoform X3 [Populus nigra]|uniref:cold-responsive protein kinase 1-like isoform X3 n=1 Tax=Populus nigra TaxID=3691 RepID=UPI002B26DA05|nr:cold-responsive protein kinase 1-like isoform X3 [Populus nigra]